MTGAVTCHHERMEDQRTAAQASSSRPAQMALIACLAGILLMLVGGVVLIIPNYAHVDVPNGGREIFFDCGGRFVPR